MYDIIHEFNDKVISLREQKLTLIKKFNLLSMDSNQVSNDFLINLTLSQIDLEYVERKLKVLN